jgi:hypothetical protein
VVQLTLTHASLIKNVDAVKESLKIAQHREEVLAARHARDMTARSLSEQMAELRGCALNASRQRAAADEEYVAAMRELRGLEGKIQRLREKLRSVKRDDGPLRPRKRAHIT